MSIKMLALSAVLVGFSALTAYGVQVHGYVGFFETLGSSAAGITVFVDLVIALSLVIFWMWGDARERALPVWPYVALTLAFGSGEREDLARFAIRRLLPERATLRAIAIRREDLAKAREEVAAKLAEQETELAELQREAGRKRATATVGLGETGSVLPVTDEEVELELMRRRAEGTR